VKTDIITIAGALGSGKSSTAKRVAAELGYRHFSSGDFFREAAKERGISIEDMNRTAEQEQATDRAVDERLRTIGAQEHGVVIDSRLAFHWIPASFKVFLTLDPHVAAERIYAHVKNEGRLSQAAESVEQVYEASLARRESERKRYRTLYDLDAEDMSAFDLVIDTGTKDLDQVVETVIAAYRAWLPAA